MKLDQQVDTLINTRSRVIRGSRPASRIIPLVTFTRYHITFTTERYHWTGPVGIIETRLSPLQTSAKARSRAVPFIAIRTTRKSADLKPFKMILLLRMYQLLSFVTDAIYILDSFPIMHAAVQSLLSLGTVHPTTNTNLYTRYLLTIGAHAPTNGKSSRRTQSRGISTSTSPKFLPAITSEIPSTPDPQRNGTMSVSHVLQFSIPGPCPFMCAQPYTQETVASEVFTSSHQFFTSSKSLPRPRPAHLATSATARKPPTSWKQGKITFKQFYASIRFFYGRAKQR